MQSTKSSGPSKIAALVILEHGPKSPQSAVASNIDQLRPPKEMATEARQAFDTLGFSVSEIVGNSFSIEASIELFEKVFKVRLQFAPDGAITVRKARGTSSLELPTESLPKNVRELVRTITFSEPPAFGPSGSGP